LDELGWGHSRDVPLRHPRAHRGINPAFIAKQLGHAQITTALSVYPQRLEEAGKGHEKSSMESGRKLILLREVAVTEGFEPSIPFRV
jgi:hypothetical protein